MSDLTNWLRDEARVDDSCDCPLAASKLRAAADEIERLTAGLKKANEQTEHFERLWYLRGDELERLRQENASLRLAVNPEYLATIPDGLPPILDFVKMEQDVIEIERLQSGLPKTADGVSMVPNMSVWIIRHGLPMERRVRSIADSLVVLTVGMVTATRITVSPNDCYSTNESAEEAIKKQAAEKARQSNG